MMFGKKKPMEDNIPCAVKAGAKIPDGMDPFFRERKTIRQLCAPGGVNPNPLGYMEFDDGGRTLYTMCFTVGKLPKRTTFATTFAPLFNFPDVTSCVFIDPQTDGKSSRKLDKRINMLDTERYEAAKQDRNRYRKISQKMSVTEAFAMDVESGDNLLYEVAFLFVLQSVSLEGLHLMANDFHSRGKEKGIELQATYSVHPEAFVSGYPTNRVFTASFGVLQDNPLKKHIFDKNSLADMFNHTRGGFTNRNGILAGHNMYTGQPYCFDPYDPSHDGYGVVIAGKTHSGKSATIKMYETRLIEFGYYVRTIDFNDVGGKGEYCNACDAVGGVSFYITPDTKNVMNLFEVDVDMDYDTKTDTEYVAFHLAEKKAVLQSLLMTMIKNGNEINDFSEITFVQSIVEDIIDNLYNALGIFDRQPESLFEEGEILRDGKIVKGRVKKVLPTLSDFYYEALLDQKKNDNPLFDTAYAIVIKGLKKFVKRLDYCPDCMLRFDSKENISSCPKCRKDIISVRGTRPYFDGQSTLHASQESPWINFDISRLPKGDKIVALLVCMSYLEEQHIKKNSANPKKARKMIMGIDEVHEAFPYAEARTIISNAYREYRKRHVSPWTATQALADYRGYEDTEAIVKNAAVIFLLKQSIQDRSFLKDATCLTDAQINEVFNLGGQDENTDKKRRGEVCVIEDNRCQFVKVDYLIDTEAVVVETDMRNIAEMSKTKRFSMEARG